MTFKTGFFLSGGGGGGGGGGGVECYLEILRTAPLNLRNTTNCKASIPEV